MGRFAPALDPPILSNGHRPGRNLRSVQTLTASADAVGESISTGAVATQQRSGQGGWQNEAWPYHDLLPELHYGTQFVGSCFSRIVLRLGWKNEAGEVGPCFNEDDEIDEDCPIDPTLIVNARNILHAFQDPLGGASSLLEAIGKNLFVVGELHLVARDYHDISGATIARRWEVLSTSEIRRKADVRYNEDGRPINAEFERIVGNQRQDIPPEAFVLRIYRRHPRWGAQADASTRPLLEVMELLTLLTRQLRATVMSRLAGAGVLFIPNEMDFPDDETAPEGTEGNDPFARELIKAMTGSISDRGSAASVVPLVVRVDADLIPAIHHLVFDSKDDDTAIAKMDALLLRFEQGVDLPVEVISGHQQCVDTETEILTAKGWRSAHEVRVGDLAWTLDHATGLAVWQPVERVSIFDPDGRDLVAIDRKAHSSLSTLDHRWPVTNVVTGARLWRESAELNTNHRIQTAAREAAAVEPKWSDDLVELIAWFYTEGHLDPRPYRGSDALTILTQSHAVNPEHVDRIRMLLTRLYGQPVPTLHRTGPSWKAPDRPLVRAWTERTEGRNTRFRISALATRDLEALAPGKYPTFEFLRSLTSAQLDLFLAVSVLADGWVVNTGTRMFSQNDARRVDAYEFAAILSGRTPSRWTVTDARHGKEQHYCSITDRTTVQPIKSGQPSVRVQHDGQVWCPTLQNGTWLARRNGRVYFTGNTTFANAVQVDESTFKAHLEPSVNLACGFLTAGYLWPSLGAPRPVDINPGESVLLPIANDDITRLVIYPDASALVTHQNREQNAIAARNMKPPLLSDSAVRRALGFSDADKPDDNERDEWIRVQQLISVKETVRAEETGTGGISLADPGVQNALDDVNAPSAPPVSDSL